MTVCPYSAVNGCNRDWCDAVNSKISGRILQLFDSEEGKQIYRLIVRGVNKSDIQSLEVVDEDGHQLRTELIVWNGAQGGCKNGDGLCLSVKLGASIERFSVRWGGRTIAKMTPYKKELMIRQRDRCMVNPAIDGAYEEWLAAHRPVFRGANNFKTKPLISIVTPLFNTPPVYLEEMLGSVLVQTYENWELVLVNASPDNEEMRLILSGLEDSRVRVVPLAENYGIAGNTNKGIEASRGDYVGFLDHDDIVDPCLLERYVEAINEDPEVDLLYCDEDNFAEIDAGFYSPLFKPDFNLDLLYSHNYVVHLLMVSRRILDIVELSPDEVSGAQDYDLTLKAVEKARSIRHISEILYHWRAHAGSTNGGQMESKPYAIAAGARALEAHFGRRGLKASVAPSRIPCVYEVSPRCDRGISTEVVVLFRSEASSRCFLSSLFDFEGEHFDRCFVVGELSKQFNDYVGNEYGGRAICIQVPSGASDIDMLRAVLPRIRSGLVAVCSDSVTFEKGEILNRLGGFFGRKEVAVASPKMLFPDGLVQYAGAFIREDGLLGYLNRNFTNDMGGGYLGMAECLCDYDAVSPDFFVARTDDLRVALSGSIATDLESFVIDFCRDARRSGGVAVTCPETVAVNAVSPFLELAEARDESFSVSEESVLWHPSVDYSSSYPRLKMARSFIVDDAKLLIKSLLKGRL